MEYEAAPEVISMDPPEYPNEAREAGLEGEVLVRVLVNQDGRVERAVVVQSVPGLDEVAIRAARTARFKPARQEGKPVTVWTTIFLQFSLE